MSTIRVTNQAFYSKIRKMAEENNVSISAITDFAFKKLISDPSGMDEIIEKSSRGRPPIKTEVRNVVKTIRISNSENELINRNHESFQDMVRKCINHMRTLERKKLEKALDGEV